MKRFVFASIAVLATFSAATASAQVWLRDRANTEGPGVRAGDLELHPGIGAEVGYDSNYFQRAPNGESKAGAVPYPVVDTARLRITPSFYVSTLTSQRKEGAPAPPPSVAFNAGAALIYSEFLSNSDKLGRSREFGVTADLAAAFAPGRPVGFNVYDNFTRTVQPSLDPDPTTSLDRDTNRAAGEFVFTKPGGLLDWRFGYAFGFTYFEQTLAQQLNNTTHEIYTRGRWKFLPRTALVYDGNVQIINYSKSPLGLSDSTPLRTRIGLSGLITDRMSLLVMGGWGASFYHDRASAGEDFDSVIGQAELRFYLTGAAPEAGTATPSLSSIAVGFTRDFVNSYLSNYYEQDRGYVNVNALFAQRFFLSLNAGIAAIHYAPVHDRTSGTVVSNAFTDTRFDASVFAEYRVRDWLGFNATFQGIGESSSTLLQYGAAGPTSATLSMKFTRVQVLGGVRAFF